MALERRYVRTGTHAALPLLTDETIIEALKYATTGEHPPNSKGGAFIHDPKVIAPKLSIDLVVF